MYVVFGVNIGNLRRYPRPRMRTQDFVDRINCQLRSRRQPFEIVSWYGHTGNFLVSLSGPTSLAVVVRQLSELLCTGCTAISPYRLERALKVLRQRRAPPAERNIRWTPGLIFRVAGGSPSTEVSSTRRARLFPFTPSIVGGWKRDREERPGRLDRGERAGGWGAIARDVGRQLGGVWTARSSRTVKGILSKAS